MNKPWFRFHADRNVDDKPGTSISLTVCHETLAESWRFLHTPAVTVRPSETVYSDCGDRDDLSVIHAE